MTQTPVGSFNTRTMALLTEVYKEVWAEVEPAAPASVRTVVRDAIAVGIMQLAKDGQTEKRELMQQGRALALQSLAACAKAS